MTEPDNKTDIQLDLAHSRTKLAAQRNELAAERTFSSWVRTGLSGVGGGIAILEFLSFKRPENIFLAQLSGLVLIVWGISVFIYALLSYYKNCTEFTAYSTVKTGHYAVTAIAMTLILLSLIILIIIYDKRL
jgi:putative membrane protein